MAATCWPRGALGGAVGSPSDGCCLGSCGSGPEGGAGRMKGLGLVTRLLVALIHLYQRFSRLTPPVCRFRPTCSEYAVGALQTYGLWRGLWLAVRRLAKCHPFHPGGYD